MVFKSILLVGNPLVHSLFLTMHVRVTFLRKRTERCSTILIIFFRMVHLLTSFNMSLTLSQWEDVLTFNFMHTNFFNYSSSLRGNMSFVAFVAWMHICLLIIIFNNKNPMIFDVEYEHMLSYSFYYVLSFDLRWTSNSCLIVSFHFLTSPILEMGNNVIQLDNSNSWWLASIASSFTPEKCTS